MLTDSERFYTSSHGFAEIESVKLTDSDRFTPADFVYLSLSTITDSDRFTPAAFEISNQ